jgi:hypothetical protein
MDLGKKPGDQPSLAGKQAQLKEELRQMQALEEEMQAQLRRQRAANHVPSLPPMMGYGDMNAPRLGQQMNPMAFGMEFQPGGGHSGGGGLPPGMSMGGPGFNLLNQQGQPLPGNVAQILLQQQRQLADILALQQQGSQQQRLPFGGNPSFSGPNDAERRGSFASSAGSQQQFGLAQMSHSPMPISKGILDPSFGFDSPGEAMRRNSLGSFGSGVPGMSPLQADFGPLKANASGVGQPQPPAMGVRQRADMPPPPPLLAVGDSVHHDEETRKNNGIDARFMDGSPTQADQRQSPSSPQEFLSISNNAYKNRQLVPAGQIESVVSTIEQVDPSGFHGVSTMASTDPPSRRTSFLGGTFEGGWQSNEDLPDRRTVIYQIIKAIEQMKPDARKMSDRWVWSKLFSAFFLG